MIATLSDRAPTARLLNQPGVSADCAERQRVSVDPDAEYTSGQEVMVEYGEESSTESLRRLNRILCEKPGSSSEDPLNRAIGPNFFNLTALSRASFRYGKRVLDIVFASAVLLVLSPVLLLCAIAIRAQSPGPILFRQRRLGKGGKEFNIFKFRTMIPNAEAVLQQVLTSDPVARAEWEADRKMRNDPRITGLGRFLRRTSLDELPQFWNVLIGEMSVVGPRPIVTSEISFYREGYGLYCAVRPGITGLWQVSGRNDTGYLKRVLLDCKYVMSWSTMLDLSIVIRTMKVMIGGLGAY